MAQWPGTPIEESEADGAWPGQRVSSDGQNPSTRDYVQGAAGQFNVGLSNLLGLPGDIVSGGLNLVGIDTGPHIFGSQSIRRATDATMGRLTNSGTMFPDAPDTAAGKLVGGAAREIGASALPSAALLHAAKGVPGAMRAAPTLWQTVADPIRRTPGRATIGETAAAAGAGVGGAVARDVAPDSKAAETWGQLIGGFAPAALAATPLSLASRGAQWVRSKVSDEARREAARRTIGDYLGEGLSSEQHDALRRSDQVSEAIPGFDPSLAERTGSPGLVAKQRDLESRMAGAELDVAAGRRRDNETAVARFAEDAAPRAAETPDLVVDVARGRVERLREGVERQQNVTDKARRDLADSLPLADRAAHGARLRERLRERVGDEHSGFEMVARELGLTDTDFQVPFEGFRNDILAAYNEATRLRMKPGAQGMQAPPQMIARIQNAEGMQNFDALMELRSDISGAIRAAERMPSVDDTYLRGLRAMKGAFDTALERAVQETADPDIVRRYAEFRNAYREQVIERLKQNASYDVLHRDAQGAYATPDEKVVEAYFQKGATTAADQFNRVFKHDAAANVALENVALDSLRRAAVRDGVIDQRSLDNWVRDHITVLRKFPNLLNRVRSVSAANQALADRQSQLVRRERIVGDALLAREMRAVDRDSRNAQETVARALESPRKMATLARSVRSSPEAQDALRRAVWDQVADMPPGDLASWIDMNRGTLRVAGITNEHMDALRTISAAREIMQRVPVPTGSAATPDSIASFVRTFGVRPDMLSNRIHAWQSGRTEKTWLATNLVSNVLTRKQAQYDNQMWLNVLYDRQIAKDLERSLMSGRFDNATARRLQTRFFALGTAAMQDEDERGIDR